MKLIQKTQRGLIWPCLPEQPGLSRSPRVCAAGPERWPGHDRSCQCLGPGSSPQSILWSHQHPWKPRISLVSVPLTYCTSSFVSMHIFRKWKWTESFVPVEPLHLMGASQHVTPVLGQLLQRSPAVIQLLQTSRMQPSVFCRHPTTFARTLQHNWKRLERVYHTLKIKVISGFSEPPVIICLSFLMHSGKLLSITYFLLPKACSETSLYLIKTLLMKLQFPAPLCLTISYSKVRLASNMHLNIHLDVYNDSVESNHV